ncbi:MAG: PIG-L family deacetylase [Deltaproteobacteria bacterium]|nr:PIG-L family deacetylase [Deltaproteobacteria bacterium]
MHSWNRAFAYAALLGVSGAVLLLGAAAGAIAAERGDTQGLADRAPTRPHLDVQESPHAPLLLPNDLSSTLLATSELVIPPDLRLIVFAPHPDDETIAAAGLIQRVRESGGEVRVVYMTNGDGYVDAVRHSVHRDKTSSADFLAYGQRRHDEALRALGSFRLGSDDAVFLGFPDDGIDDLWAGHWSDSNPYTSPYTRFDRPPYKDSWIRNVEYAGTDLKGAITRVVDDFQPNWVVVPDPRDRHPDHCTTAVFVLDVLQRAQHIPARAPVRVLAYLVHYPDYPASANWAKQISGAGVGGTSAASRELSGTPWLRLPLSSSQQATKGDALNAYASQLEVMRPFLRQFLRSYELFTELDDRRIAGIPREYAARFGRALK